METVTVSRKFQIVIPRAARKTLGIKPGQKVHVIPHDGRIELIPVEPIGSGRGFLKRIDTNVERDSD